MPGSTPFLLSNAVVEGLRGIVDVHGGVLSFHGSRDVVRLRQVRKKLCCLKIMELLKVRHEEGMSETCVNVHAHRETSANQNTARSHPSQMDMHAEFEHRP